MIFQISTEIGCKFKCKSSNAVGIGRNNFIINNGQRIFEFSKGAKCKIFLVVNNICVSVDREPFINCVTALKLFFRIYLIIFI